MSIGIFWSYKGVVFGKVCNIEDGFESALGIVDSDYSHYDVWEHETGFEKPFLELMDTEYQQYPRGRVLYDKTKATYLVYLDRSLSTKQAKVNISEYFSIVGKRTRWLLDSHYKVFSGY